MGLAGRLIIGIMCAYSTLSCVYNAEENMASVEDRVKKIVVDLLGVDESRVDTGSHFRDDLEADSLDLVELIMAFEEEFGGEITDEDAQKIETVGQAVTYIRERMTGGD